LTNALVRAFIALRQYALRYAELNRKIEDFLNETNSQFEDIYHILDELSAHIRENLLNQCHQSSNFFVLYFTAYCHLSEHGRILSTCK